MTTEQAAERLRRLYGGESYYTIYGCHHTLGGEQHEDERKVINAYLAEHDPTPIDEAWLRGIGFDGPMFDMDRLALVLGRFRFTNYCGWNLWRAVGPGPAQIWERVVNDVKTQGDFYRLAQCLGITLHEDTNQRSEP